MTHYLDFVMTMEVQKGERMALKLSAAAVEQQRKERFHINTGFRRVFGRNPSSSEAQVLAGIGWLESNFATAWKGPGIGSRNKGAIQCCKPRPTAEGLMCPPTAFLYTDTHPNADGTSTPYSICFKKYASEEDAWADQVKVTYIINHRESVLKAAQRGSVWDCSAQLRDTGYYEGYGKTREERIGNHARAPGSAVARHAEALGEKPMEPFSIDDLAEETFLFDRVRMLTSVTLEFDWGAHNSAVTKDILERTERGEYG